MKGHNVSNYKYTIGEELKFTLEGQSKCSSHVIVVLAKEMHKSNKKSKKRDRKSTDGHILDDLAEVLFPFVASWRIKSIRAAVSGNDRVAPEGKRVYL